VVGRPDGRPLDTFQASLVIEFQAALAAVMAAMNSQPDRPIDDVSQDLIEQGIIGVLAAMNGGSSFALFFHRDLLGTIKRLLLSTYEGQPATIAVVVIPGTAASRLRWTRVVQDGIPLLQELKAARVLSDGQDLVFAFSAEGEFFGLFEKRQCLDKLRGVSGLVEWRIRQAFALSLNIDERRCLELVSGSWRYVDEDNVAERAILGSDPSFSGPNRLVWALARRLSEARQGGLLLVVKDPAALVAANCCKAEEVNLREDEEVKLRGAPSRITALLEEHLEKHQIAGDGPVRGLSLQPKEILLEQFRDKTVDEIGLEVLSRLAAVDGAVLVRTDGILCGFGIILSMEGNPGVAPTEGSRTRAASLASRFGVAIKISADGPIAIYKDQVRVFP
jgi:hypothetical protein